MQCFEYVTILGLQDKNIRFYYLDRYCNKIYNYRNWHFSDTNLIFIKMDIRIMMM